MDDRIFDRIQEVDLKKTMETSYIDYAMSVIASRAIPDVRDGLKPVQRRILYSMIELGNTPDKPHRKCARIVGDTMGKYHPHGDSSIYGALVYMAQPWSMRYCLVDGHGNFGSVDGDGAAAMRYTEARLTKISLEMINNLNKDTVDFVPNFDETEKEPAVMPSRFPNLLVNGTTGIAVGMATNIPPHNLREVVGACTKIINNRIEEDRDTELAEILPIIKAPDFPTGGIVMGMSGVNEAYKTGRGKILVRAVTDIEPMANGKNRIIVTELPYLVNKSLLIQKIAELAKTKRIEGITDLRDESDREGMRIMIELRHDVNPNVILNQLYKHTQLQDTFGVIMLALVNNEPKVMNLLQVLNHYLAHQEEVVTRRTKYDLNKAKERDHILQGLLVALDNIDEVVSIIRHSASVQEAKATLMERFTLTEPQSQAIVDMRLRALTGLERGKIQGEHEELIKTIAYLESLLADRKLMLGVVRDELEEIAEKFGDDRRTRIEANAATDLLDEDLIPDGNILLARTSLGYIKRMSTDNFKAQGRGGRGIKGMSTINDDQITDLLMCDNHSQILFFTNKGRVYKLKAYEIPEGSRTSRGTAIINLLQLQPGEKVSNIISIPKDMNEDKNLLLLTKNGTVKKTPLSSYGNIYKGGLIAMSLRDDDELIEAKLTDENDLIFIATAKGMGICFKEEDVRVTGRDSMGVRGIELSDDDYAVGMQLSSQGEDLLLVTEKGMGKRTRFSEFRTQNRGGKGLISYKISDKTGNVMGVKAVDNESEIMLITTGGVLIQIRMNEVRTLGRITEGVRLIVVDEGTTVAQIAKVRIEESDDLDVSEELEEAQETAEAQDVAEPAETKENVDTE